MNGAFRGMSLAQRDRGHAPHKSAMRRPPQQERNDENETLFRTKADEVPGIGPRPLVEFLHFWVL